MFDSGYNFNVVRRVTLHRLGEFIVKASYDKSAKNSIFLRVLVRILSDSR